jgi:hypothetical protein
MEKGEEGRQETRKQGMTEEQQNKILLLFFLLKKLKVRFKAEIFLALTKIPASKPELDKWAFIFTSQKLPFGLDELKTFIEDILSSQLEGLPLKLEVKKVKYENRVCFAIEFEVTVKLEEKKLQGTKNIADALKKKVTGR